MTEIGGITNEWSIRKAFECIANRERKVTRHGVSVGNFYSNWFQGDYYINCADRAVSSKTDSDRLRQAASVGGQVPRSAGRAFLGSGDVDVLDLPPVSEQQKFLASPNWVMPEFSWHKRDGIEFTEEEITSGNGIEFTEEERKLYFSTRCCTQCGHCHESNHNSFTGKPYRVIKGWVNNKKVMYETPVISCKEFGDRPDRFKT